MKQRLLLSIILLLSHNFSKAQENWKILYDQFFTEMSADSNYIWALNGKNLLQISTNDFNFEERLDSMNKYDGMVGLSSINDECWVSLFDLKTNAWILRNYKNKNYKEFTAQQLGVNDNRKDDYLYFKFSNYFSDKKRSLFYNSIHHSFLYYRDNSFKEIISNSTIPPFLKMEILDENTFLCQSYDEIHLIDTNGIIKKTFSTDILSNPSNYIMDFTTDKNGNIYFARKNIGILKLSNTSLDSTPSLLISIPNFGLNDNKPIVRYCSNATLLVVNDGTAGVYTTLGSYLLSYSNIPTGTNMYFDRNLDISKNNKLTTCNGGQILFHQNNQFVDLIQYKNRSYNQIQTAEFGKNNFNIWAAYNSLYHFENNVIKYSNLNNPTSIEYVNGSTKDHNDNIFIVIDSSLYRIDDNNNKTLIASLPQNLKLSPTEVYERMKVNNNNEIQFLAFEYLTTLNQNGNWTSINKNNTIDFLYAFDNDKNNNIWFATNKGIASITNNEISLSSIVDEIRPVNSIKFNKNLNSLVYTIKDSNPQLLVVFNLDSNKKYSFQLNSTFGNEILSIDFDKNDYLWITTSISDIYKCDISKMTFDIKSQFNSSNSILFPNAINLVKVDNLNNKYFFSNNAIYIYNENGLILSSEFNKQSKGKNILLYPNPSKSSLTIQQETKIQTIKIYNIQGKLLMKYDNVMEKTFTLDFNKKLEKGVYIFETTDINNRIITSRFIYED